jgi:GDP-4-dehydro-6-deoxy-D-mannose reductase
VGIKVTIEVDQSLLRPNENRIVIGNNDKLKRATGWQAHFSLEQSLHDIIAYWKGMLHPV